MRAAIYCRLSEEDKDKHGELRDSESIQNQRSLLLRYAKERGWEVHACYIDDDYAGADRNRPAFCRLLADAQARAFDVILCKTQSRFTRELELVEKYIHGEFVNWGIRFIGVVDNADTEIKGNKKARQINGLINEWYLEDMSDNIKSVLTNRRQNGLHIGAFAPYGYQKDPQKRGHLLVDNTAAEVVREVFALFSQGWGKAAIARLLNERGEPTATAYKQALGLRYSQPGKGGGLWRYCAISSMLTNRVYLGDMVQGRYASVSYKSKVSKPVPKEQWMVVEGTHEGIIPRGLWERVQALVAERAKPFGSGEVGLFAKKARCGACGYLMRSQKNRGRHYLQCATRLAAPSACAGAFVSVGFLEKAVLAELLGFCHAYLDLALLERAPDPGIRAANNRGRQEEALKRLEKELEPYADSMKLLYLDKLRGLLTDEEFAALSSALRQDKARLEARASEARARLAALWGQGAAASRSERIAAFTSPSALSRPVVEAFIDHLSVGQRDPATGRREIEIHWNF